MRDSSLTTTAVSQEEEAGPSPQRLSGVQWWAVAALALVAVAAGWLVRDRREAPIDEPACQRAVHALHRLPRGRA